MVYTLLAIIGVLALLNVIQYQINRGRSNQLKDITERLRGQLEQRPSEKLLLMTDDRELKSLLVQLNFLLDSNQSITAQFRKTERLGAIDFVPHLISIVAFAFATAGTSLIPLYFGMRKYSVPTTIISSLLIVALTSMHNPIISLASIIYIPLALAVVGLLIAWWSIRDIEKVDIV